MTNQVDFDQYTENYNQLLKEKTSFFSSDEIFFAHYKVDIIKKIVRFPVYRLLEYGCGIGRNIPFLQQAFPRAVIMGSDISATSIEIAERNNTNVIFFLENEDYEPTIQFDLIFVAGVFHHIPVAQRLKILKKLFNRLSPGGRLFVFEHNPYNPVTRHIVNNCAYDEDAVLLKPSELASILREASFIIERKAYCLFIPPRLSILSRLESKFEWLPIGGQYWIMAKCSL